MRKIYLVTAVLAAACGGGAVQDEFGRATPSFDSMALDITDADGVPENLSAPAAQALTAADACHPHLFARTHALVAATNGGIWRVLRPIQSIIRIAPRRRDGGTHVWERVVDGFDYKYSIVKTGDHSFTATLVVKKVGDPDSAFVTIYSASVQRNPAEHDGSGNALLDLDKLNSVTGEAVSGQLSLSFNVTAAEKTVVFTMTNFTVSSDPARSGHYVFDKQYGKGGSLKFQADMVLACTGATPAASGTTPVQAVARWLDVSGGVHFRGDAGATGGQVPSGDKWEGVTCAEGGARGTQPRETYWMMKLEGPDGQTISARSAQNTEATAAACDPAFGAVPAIDNAATDYDFSKVNFASNDPLPFP